MKNMKSGSIQSSRTVALTDDELEDMVGLLWENVDCLPSYVQNALYESREPGKAGSISYALVAGWATGRFEYQVNYATWDTVVKSGWVPLKEELD